MLFGIHVQDYRVDCLPVVTTNKKIQTATATLISDAWCTWWNYRVPKSDDWQCDLTTWKEQDSGRQVERKKKDAKNNPTVLAALVQSSCQRKMCKVENGIHYLCIHPGQTNKNDRPSFAPTTWNHCNSLIIHWTVWLIDIRDTFIIVQYCIDYINNYIDDKQYLILIQRMWTVHLLFLLVFKFFQCRVLQQFGIYFVAWNLYIPHDTATNKDTFNWCELWKSFGVDNLNAF